jgi:short-subunit dehydrogenase
MKRTAIIIGNSDGIGLATTRELLERGWKIAGVSRSASPVDHPDYRHIQKSVQDPDYPDTLKTIVGANSNIDLSLYCVGIGELLDPKNMEPEVEVIAVNFLGMVKTAAELVPPMVKRGTGHFMGLSSLADEMLSPEAPSYHASKAGFSNYLESLALALKPTGVSVTNIRFGFVDTKMAKGDVKPFMMSVERAVGHVLKCIKKKPVRYTAPSVVIPLVRFRSWWLRRKTKSL